MEERTKPVAAFMAFGTKGDVYPLTAIAAALASDQEQYHVVLITHSAHQNLEPHLARKCVSFYPISSPPVLPVPHDYHTTDSTTSSSAFQQQKKELTIKHREECYYAVESVFGNGPTLEGDFIVINFFALEGWNLAELFRVRCIIAAPYVVPYSAPSSFEHCFRKEHPLLYKYFQEAPTGKVCWKDVIHWMWPLFTENWGLWRSDELNLSACPFTDPVTGLPSWHERATSPKLLYGFSKEVVDCPDYWPSNVHCCGFWFLPVEWQFSCEKCGEISAALSCGDLKTSVKMCSAHVELQAFLEAPTLFPPIFIGLSSIASMGFLKNPQAFLLFLKRVLETTGHRFILFTAGYEPLNRAIQVLATDMLPCDLEKKHLSEQVITLFNGLLFCFSGSMPYNLLFTRCAAAIHHGGSGSTAAALSAGIPQIICPFMLDQFYWAERMCWIGVAPEPLKRKHLVPDTVNDMDIKEAVEVLSDAIKFAVSPQVRARAVEIASRISVEDGVGEAVEALKQEIRLL